MIKVVDTNVMIHRAQDASRDAAVAQRRVDLNAQIAGEQQKAQAQQDLNTVADVYEAERRTVDPEKREREKGQGRQKKKRDQREEAFVSMMPGGEPKDLPQVAQVPVRLDIEV